MPLLARTWLPLCLLGCAFCADDPSLDARPDGSTEPEGAIEAGAHDADADAKGDADAGSSEAAVVAPEVEVGVPAGEDGLGFAALEPNQELRLQTFGQGGTHLMLGVRARGFGNRAFVTITLRNLETDAEAISPPPARPQLFWCHDDGNCDLVPLLAMTAGLVPAGESAEGLEIEVTAHVQNEDGVEAEASGRASLSTKDL